MTDHNAKRHDRYSAKVEFEKPTGDDGHIVLTGPADSPRGLVYEALEYVPTGGDPTHVGWCRGNPDTFPDAELIAYHDWIIAEYEAEAPAEES